MHRDDQTAVPRCDLPQIVPLQIASLVVPEIYRFPIRIVPRIDGATALVKFVVKDQPVPLAWDLAEGGVSGSIRRGVRRLIE